MNMSPVYWSGNAIRKTTRPMRFSALLLMALLAGCGGQGLIQSPTSTGETRPALTLDTAIHFATPDGAPVLALPDEYRVEQATGMQLRLTPKKGGQPLLLAATATTHDIDISSPFPLLLALNEDARNLVFLYPDGTALDAAGSLSGVLSRDIAQARRRYQLAYQLDPASGQVQFGDGVTGQRPSGGQSQLTSNYRVGAGTEGNVNSALTTDSELYMIQLQSIVSQRQQAVQLTTQIITAQNEPFRLEYNSDRLGGDYGQRATVSPEACRTICSADGNCQAFTFVKPPAGLSTGQCFLKRTVPTPVGNGCCVSAKRKSAQQEIIGNIGR